jgi:predicted RNA binding protein YcfA (HicA-like mRNA interferase family)
LNCSTICGTIYLDSKEVFVITQQEKLEQRIRRIPVPNDITFEEFDAFLVRRGFIRTRQKGSHVAYTYVGKGGPEVIAFSKPHHTSSGILGPYIRKVLETIDRINEANRSD